MITEFFYRVEESRWTEENGHKDIQIRAFPVVKTTPHGVWLNLGKWDVEPFGKNRKFVLRKNGKYAQPTPELAMKMFQHRKMVHIRMMKFRLDVIERVYARAKNGEKPANIDKVMELVVLKQLADGLDTNHARYGGQF